MSHRAMNWALEQRNLKPATWIVLIKLADRHNRDTLRIDPQQALLAADCNMSRSSVNKHLETLEWAGLIVRVPRKDPTTRKQLSSFYILAVDFDAPPEIELAEIDYIGRIEEVRVAKQDTESRVRKTARPVSEKAGNPCPKNDVSRVQNPDTNHVIEPGREPRREPRNLDTGVSSSPKGDVMSGCQEDLSHAVQAFNDAAERAGWPQIDVLNNNRPRMLKARLREVGGVDGWVEVIRKASASDYLQGNTEHRFRLTFDWFVKSEFFTKVREGNYDNKAASPTRRKYNPTIEQALRASGGQ